MHPIELIASCLSEENSPTPALSVKQTCAVTGNYTLCVPRKDLLKKGFTNEAILKAPLSEWVSLEAFRVLRYRPERAWSWICDGKMFRMLNRAEVRSIVIGEQYPSMWTGYVTTSYKKHGSLWARVNRGGKRFWRFEALDVDCTDHDALLSIWNRLNEELRAGIGRQSIESLRCPPFVVRKVGVDRWIAFEKWARGIVASPLYRFLCYLLPSQEEMKNERLHDGVASPLEDIDFFAAVDEI